MICEFAGHEWEVQLGRLAGEWLMAQAIAA